MAWPTKRKRKFGVRSERAEKAPRKSWLPGQKGQGAEGLSKGYGGSEGPGVGASGPQTQASTGVENDDDEREADDRDKDQSPSLPSRTRIARVLR